MKVEAKRNVGSDEKRNKVFDGGEEEDANEPTESCPQLDSRRLRETGPSSSNSDDENEWELGIGDLIIDLDADIEKNKDMSSGGGKSGSGVNKSKLASISSARHPSSSPNVTNNVSSGSLNSAIVSSSSDSIPTPSSSSEGGKSSGGGGHHGHHQHQSSNVAFSSNTIGVEHQATVEKGLKMKIKRKHIGGKDEKHEIVHASSEKKMPSNVPSSNPLISELSKSLSKHSKSKSNSHKEKKEKHRDRYSVSSGRKSNVSATLLPDDKDSSSSSPNSVRITSMQNGKSGENLNKVLTSDGMQGVDSGLDREKILGFSIQTKYSTVINRVDSSPHNIIKSDQIDDGISASTRDSSTSTASVGTLTDGDCLGPCEPGTSVTLDGIVWQETEGGILVVNVTWRDKSYVGTLLDCTQNDWGSPRFCDSPASDIETKCNKNGRGKRGRSVGMESVMDRNFTRRLRNGKGRKTANSGFSIPMSPLRNDGLSSLAINNSMKRKSKHPDLEFNEKSKRNRFPSAKLATVAVASSEGSQLVPVSPILIECPEPNCKKKYKHINGLKYHTAHAHSGESCELNRLEAGKDQNSDEEYADPGSSPVSPSSIPKDAKQIISKPIADVLSKNEKHTGVVEGNTEEKSEKVEIPSINLVDENSKSHDEFQATSSEVLDKNLEDSNIQEKVFSEFVSSSLEEEKELCTEKASNADQIEESKDQDQVNIKCDASTSKTNVDRGKIENVPSPAYSDISDANESETEEEKNKLDEITQKTTDIDSSYWMYQYLNQNPYLLPPGVEGGNRTDNVRDGKSDEYKGDNNEGPLDFSEGYNDPYNYTYKYMQNYQYPMDHNFILSNESIKSSQLEGEKEKKKKARYSIMDGSSFMKQGNIHNEHQKTLKESIELKLQLEDKSANRESPTFVKDEIWDLKKFSKSSSTISTSPKKKELKDKGVKATMETTGPPPAQINNYYLHPSFLSSVHGPNPFPFDGSSSLEGFRGRPGVIGPFRSLPSGAFIPREMKYPPGRPKIRPRSPEIKSEIKSPSSPKSLDLLQQVSHKYPFQKMEELKARTPSSAPSAPHSSHSHLRPQQAPPKASSITDSDSTKISRQVGKEGKEIPSSGGSSKSPPPQRHLHTHHHTHVGYPIYDPYGVLIASQQAAAGVLPYSIPKKSC